jgi:hypothetical protein
MRPVAGFALASLALFGTRGEALDLHSRTISNSKQFVVFCADSRLRGQVASFVEDVKADTLRLLGEPDRWKIPVVINFEPASQTAKAPVVLWLQETMQGPKIEIDVQIGDDPAAVNLRKHIVRALLIELAYRDRPVQGGQPFAEPAWWVVAGALETFRCEDAGVGTDLFRRLVTTNRMPPIEEFLGHHSDDLGGAAEAMDGACAMALLQLLIEQPAGRDGLARLVREWPNLHHDPIAALTRTFPGLGQGSTDVQKWWTLNLARFAELNRFKGLSMEDTDKELNALLDVELVVDQAGATRTFQIGEFASFLKLRGARQALNARHQAILNLSTRANALLRPVVSGYEEVLAMLERGKTRGLRDRMVRIEIYRETVMHRIGEIADYLNWYEATQFGARSGAFDSFLRTARAVGHEQRRSGSSNAIGQYLDELQEQL